MDLTKTITHLLQANNNLEFDQGFATFNKSCALVDTTIEEATNNKKSLASTMGSVSSLMKQVEYSEKAAAQAKEEAAISGLHIFAKVDELKTKQELVKEKNAKHAGEVTARKMVLATEVNELQSRVSGVLNEGFTTLGVLNQMRCDLEKRLTSVLEEKKLADKEKVERDILARKILAYEESQMDELVKESERLKQEEVNNSKLQQFLLDRGLAIDMLDKDISRKCQDVSLLKESLNQAVLSSSQTSSMLVCSTSSLRSPFLNQPINSHMDHGVLGFEMDSGLVQGKEPIRRAKTASLKPLSLRERPNMDLKAEVKKDLASGADLKISPLVSDIAQTGHSKSTYDHWVASQSTKTYSAGRGKKGESKKGKVVSRSKPTTSELPKVFDAVDYDENCALYDGYYEPKYGGYDDYW